MWLPPALTAVNASCAASRRTLSSATAAGAGVASRAGAGEAVGVASGVGEVGGEAAGGASVAGEGEGEAAGWPLHAASASAARHSRLHAAAARPGPRVMRRSITTLRRAAW